jgi:hypothetical protein
MGKSRTGWDVSPLRGFIPNYLRLVLVSFFVFPARLDFGVAAMKLLARSMIRLHYHDHQEEVQFSISERTTFLKLLGSGTFMERSF